jgi:hypothetical protein
MNIELPDNISQTLIEFAVASKLTPTEVTVIVLGEALKIFLLGQDTGIEKLRLAMRRAMDNPKA